MKKWCSVYRYHFFLIRLLDIYTDRSSCLLCFCIESQHVDTFLQAICNTLTKKCFIPGCILLSTRIIYFIAFGYLASPVCSQAIVVTPSASLFIMNHSPAVALLGLVTLFVTSVANFSFLIRFCALMLTPAIAKRLTNNTFSSYCDLIVYTLFLIFTLLAESYLIC